MKNAFITRLQNIAMTLLNDGTDAVMFSVWEKFVKLKMVPKMRSWNVFLGNNNNKKHLLLDYKTQPWLFRMMALML